MYSNSFLNLVINLCNSMELLNYCYTVTRKKVGFAFKLEYDPIIGIALNSLEVKILINSHSHNN